MKGKCVEVSNLFIQAKTLNSIKSLSSPQYNISSPLNTEYWFWDFFRYHSLSILVPRLTVPNFLIPPAKMNKSWNGIINLLSPKFWIWTSRFFFGMIHYYISWSVFALQKISIMVTSNWHLIGRKFWVLNFGYGHQGFFGMIHYYISWSVFALQKISIMVTRNQHLIGINS